MTDVVNVIVDIIAAKIRFCLTESGFVVWCAFNGCMIIWSLVLRSRV